MGRYRGVVYATGAMDAGKDEQVASQKSLPKNANGIVKYPERTVFLTFRTPE